MKISTSIATGLAVGLAFAGGAAAADLATGTASPSPAACLASFSDFMSATAQSCPLTYLGVTVYGQVDVGAGWSAHASKFNPFYNNGVLSVISKTSQGPAFQWVPNGLSQSNIGVRGREEIAPGWQFVFDVNASIDPYSLHISDGPKSLTENNDRPLIDQSTNSDSSRAGQWDNTRGDFGVSSAVFGTLTAGRQPALSGDLVGFYDPMGGSYAFSLIGFSSTLGAGLGDTETARYNTSVRYQVAYDKVRAAAIWQFGGYELGNGSNGAYQFDLGADLGGFSIDGIYSYARDAVSLSTYSSGTLPKGASVDDLKATLADIDAGIVGVKYARGPFATFAGYEVARYRNPTDAYATDAVANGFTSLGDYHVLPRAANVTITAYTNNKILQVAWIGASYAIRSDLDLTGAYYYTSQNNFYPTTLTAKAAAAACLPNTTNSAATGFQTLQGPANTYCAGYEQAVSGLVDWRPFRRLDIYAGIMVSYVAGGLASGFFHTSNIAPTMGLRLNF